VKCNGTADSTSPCGVFLSVKEEAMTREWRVLSLLGLALGILALLACFLFVPDILRSEAKRKLDTVHLQLISSFPVN
jgi:hypothetical protein